MVQLSPLYMATGQTVVLALQTFIGRVMSLLFSPLSRLAVAFLPRSSLPLSRLQAPSAAILEPKKRGSVTVSTFSPSVCHAVRELRAMILVFLNMSS